MPLTFAAVDQDAIPLHAVTPGTLEDWLDGQGEATAAFVRNMGFSGALGTSLAVPSEAGALRAALVGLGTTAAQARARFALAGGFSKLPVGTYRIETTPEGFDLQKESLGCLLTGYRFTLYKDTAPAKQALVAPDAIDAAAVEALANAEALTRDLINTPAADMGPTQLEEAARALAERTSGEVTTITDDALLDENFPLIHTVGRAAADRPRLIDMRWPGDGPQVTLVGKGVCFDTGGLNLKPGASMGLMKKDMGGAATVLGLAQMIRAVNLPVRLRVLIPAVENAVSAGAFRPGDVLTSRKGLTVEVNNTDAEGRLVLADALALACEESPDLLISMATLTGAARVAVGPDLAPYYTDDEALSDAITTAAGPMADPVWRLPFHDPYEAMIEPAIADLDNAPSGGFAGSITAALFLRRFVSDGTRYAHFDIYGWQPTAAPGRPKGGTSQGARALLGAITDLMGS